MAPSRLHDFPFTGMEQLGGVRRAQVMKRAADHLFLGQVQGFLDRAIDVDETMLATLESDRRWKVVHRGAQELLALPHRAFGPGSSRHVGDGQQSQGPLRARHHDR